MKSHILLAVLSAVFLVSCGSDSGGGSKQAQQEQGAGTRETISVASYYGILRPVNFSSNGFIPYGAAFVNLNNDEVKVNVTLDDDQAVQHRQTLHAGSRCPTLQDDSNGDGFVDYDEAIRVVGKPLIPLDSDINSQVGGQEVFLRGPAMTYNRTGMLSKINADLRSNGLMPADQGINFLGRVVLVHGTSFNSSFPTSLASHAGEQPHLSLPVVCGILGQI